MNEEARARLRKVKETFTQVAESAPEDREALLARLTASDETLRHDVEQLLAFGENVDAVLDRPVGPAMRYRPGDTLAGRYRLTAFVGSGGMGDVYAGVDERDGKAVALKCIRRFGALDGKAEARLRREVRMAGAIHHPNVCAIYGLEEHEGENFSVMELLTGETLAAYLQRHGAMTVAEALPVVRQILDGLVAAHGTGVVHRDLKPSNVMLVDGRAVIIDFGLAAAAPGRTVDSQSLTASGVVIGTLAYIAPEQLSGEECGPAADLYSLGVILFEMLTGVRPHEAKSPFQLAAQKTHETGIQAALRHHAVPPVWAEIIAGCLRARVEERIRSAAEVRALLDRGRPSMRFWLRRRKWWVEIPAAAAMAGIALWMGWNGLARDYQPRGEAAVLYERGEAALVGAAPMGGIQLLERAVRADGRFILARAALAGAYAEMDQPDKAREAVLQATSQADARLVLGRGERYALEGARAAVLREFPLAADWYAKVAASSSGPSRHHALLAQARMEEQSGAFDGARARLAMVLREDPENTTARVRLAALMCRRRDYEAAAREFARAEAANEKAGNIEGLCDAMVVRLSVLRDQTATEKRQTIERVRELARRSGNRYHALTAQFQTAMLAQQEREYDRAIAVLREASVEAQREGMPVLAARAMGDLGYGFLYLKRPRDALPILREALTMAERTGSKGVEATIRMQLAEAVGYEGLLGGGIEIMEPAVAWLRKHGSEETLPLVLIKWGTALNDSTRFRETLEAFEEALAVARRNGNELYQSMALQRMGGYFYTRDLRKAVAVWEQALPLAARTGLTVIYYAAAETYLALGNYERGLELVEQGDRQAAQRYPAGVDRDNFRRRSVVARARIAQYRGDCDTAARLLEGTTLDKESMKYVMDACRTGVTQAQMRQDLAAVEKLISEFHATGWYARARCAADGALAALHLGDWAGVKRLARLGIDAARQGWHPLYELQSLLALRAAQRALHETAAAEETGRLVLETAGKVGFAPAERFGERNDLMRLWE